MTITEMKTYSKPSKFKGETVNIEHLDQTNNNRERKIPRIQNTKVQKKMKQKTEKRVDLCVQNILLNEFFYYFK